MTNVDINFQNNISKIKEMKSATWIVVPRTTNLFLDKVKSLVFEDTIHETLNLLIEHEIPRSLDYLVYSSVLGLDKEKDDIQHA